MTKKQILNCLVAQKDEVITLEVLCELFLQIVNSYENRIKEFEDITISNVHIEKRTSENMDVTILYYVYYNIKLKNGNVMSVETLCSKNLSESYNEVCIELQNLKRGY